MKKLLLSLSIIYLTISVFAQIKVSELPEANTINNSDLYLLTQFGASKKLTHSTLNSKLFNPITNNALRFKYGIDSLRFVFSSDSGKFYTNKSWYVFNKNIHIPSNYNYYIGSLPVATQNWVTSQGYLNVESDPVWDAAKNNYQLKSDTGLWDATRYWTMYNMPLMIVNDTIKADSIKVGTKWLSDKTQFGSIEETDPIWVSDSSNYASKSMLNDSINHLDTRTNLAQQITGDDTTRWGLGGTVSTQNGLVNSGSTIALDSTASKPVYLNFRGANGLDYLQFGQTWFLNYIKNPTTLGSVQVTNTGDAFTVDASSDPTNRSIWQFRLDSLEVTFTKQSTPILKIKNNGVFYNSHTTVQNNYWLTDKQYVDSVATSIESGEFQWPDSVCRLYMKSVNLDSNKLAGNWWARVEYAPTDTNFMIIPSHIICKFHYVYPAYVTNEFFIQLSTDTTTTADYTTASSISQFLQSTHNALCGPFYIISDIGTDVPFHKNRGLYVRNATLGTGIGGGNLRINVYYYIINKWN
jgi:hypothetical protein